MDEVLSIDDKSWQALVDRSKRNVPYAVVIRNNAARTTIGEICSCMTRNKTWGKYSATYVQTNGVRQLACREWDLRGVSLDEGMPDLDMSTVKAGMRII